MTASEAFVAFAKFGIARSKRDRMITLASTKNGQRKIVESLHHEFDSAICSTAVRGSDWSKFLDKPCFAFHSQLGFGEPFATVRDAYDWLSGVDSWLSAGIHRTEDGWSHESVVVR